MAERFLGIEKNRREKLVQLFDDPIEVACASVCFARFRKALRVQHAELEGGLWLLGNHRNVDLPRQLLNGLSQVKTFFPRIGLSDGAGVCEIQQYITLR
jgi:hypothetical protein